MPGTGGSSKPLSIAVLEAGGPVTWVNGHVTNFSKPALASAKARHCPGYVKSTKKAPYSGTEPSLEKFSGTVTSDNTGLKVPGKYKGEVCISQSGSFSAREAVEDQLIFVFSGPAQGPGEGVVRQNGRASALPFCVVVKADSSSPGEAHDKEATRWESGCGCRLMGPRAHFSTCASRPRWPSRGIAVQDQLLVDAVPGASQAYTTRSTFIAPILAVYLVSRLIVLGVLLDIYGPHRTIVRLAGIWDGNYYLRIAAHGYTTAVRDHGSSVIAYFPLYPVLVRGTAPLVGDNWVLAGAIVSVTAGAVACLAVGALARDQG